jgi:hypothetical protein
MVLFEERTALGVMLYFSVRTLEGPEPILHSQPRGPGKVN